MRRQDQLSQSQHAEAAEHEAAGLSAEQAAHVVDVQRLKKSRKKPGNKAKYSAAQRVLRSFILKRLLRDPILAEKHTAAAKSKSHALLGDAFKAAMGKLTLKRFLTLLLFQGLLQCLPESSDGRG